MSDMIAKLRVALQLETAAFEKGTKRAAAEVDAFGTKAEKLGFKIGQMGKAVVSAGTAIAAGGVALALKSAVSAGLDYASTLGNAAKISGASVGEFQRMAFAAQSVGIETDKLAGIYKDVNDKFGEFLSTNGGELKDFFTNIAPKVGVTAEQFRNLSGPEALQLYVNSLEKAGVGQKEMTFYMEAIADDATALVPLLRNNGAEARRLASDVDALGITMDEAMIKKAGEAHTKLTQLGNVMSAKLAIAVTDQIGPINELANAFLGLITRLGDTVKAFREWQAEVGARQLDRLADAEEGWLGSGDHSKAARYRAGAAALREKAKGLRGEAYTAMPGSGGRGGAGGTYRTTLGAKPRLIGDWSGARVGGPLKTNLLPGTALSVGGGAPGRGLLPTVTEKQMGEMQTFAAKLFAASENLRQTFANPTYQKIRDRLEDVYRNGPEPKAREMTPELAAKAFKDRLGGARYNEIEGRLREQWQRLSSGARDTEQAVSQSFADMAQSTIDSLQRMTNAFQNGDFLSKLSAILGLVTQLGSIGLFGKSFAGKINGASGGGFGSSFGGGFGARAAGGPVNANGLYLVGERGPELLQMGNRGGNIIPNHALGGGTVHIVPSPYFDVVVDNRVGRAAPTIAQAGSQLAQRRMAYRNSRRLA